MRKTYFYFTMLTSVLSATLAFAADRTWNNSAGGDFNDADNWTGGMPGVADRALINASGTYTVYLDQNREVVGLRMNDSESPQDVTFDLGGYTLRATGDGTSDFAFLSSSMIKRTLRIVNGQLEGGRLRVESATAADQPGHLIVGQDGVLIVGTSGGGDSRIGNAGQGLLEVIDNGRFESRRTLQIGTLTDYPTAKGTLVVDGSEARFVGTNVNVGANQEGHMHVINGAQASVSGDLILASSLGRPDGSRGFLEVTTGGHVEVEGGRGLQIGGISGDASRPDDPELWVSRVGHATIASGGTVNTSHLRVYEGSTLLIDGGAIVSTGTTLFREESIYQVFLNTVDDIPLDVINVTITDAILDVQLGDGFVAEDNGFYTVIDYSGSLTGLFVNSDGQTLASGDEINIGGHVFRLDYGSGSDGVIGLELIPEPGSFAVMAGVLIIGGTLLLRRRKQS